MSAKKTDTLLPPSQVSIFVQDDNVRANAERLASDWRYGRVDVDVYPGGITTAIETLAETDASPDLIIVETPRTDETLTEQLGTLAENCHEDTTAIVIGPVNDVNLYRTLRAMGVSDYLVPPIDAEDFAEIIAQTLIERFGTAGSQLIVFLGAKGGVGTSVLTQAAGEAIANRLRQKTIILDAAGGWSYLSVAMGTEPAITFRSAVRAARASDEDSFQRMIYNVDDCLSILNVGGDPMLEGPSDPDNLEYLIDRLESVYPVVLFDASRVSVREMRTVIARANANIVVSTPTLASLRHAQGLIHEIAKLRSGGDRKGNDKDKQRGDLELVLNMQGANPAYEVEQNYIAEIMETEPGLSIAYSPKTFMAAESQNERISNTKGGDQHIDTLVPLLKRHVQVSVRKHSGQRVKGYSKLIEKFIKRIGKT